MKISELIRQLQSIKKEHGEIEVTCTAAMVSDGYSFTTGDTNSKFPDVIESTVENLLVQEPSGKFSKKRVRVYF